MTTFNDRKLIQAIDTVRKGMRGYKVHEANDVIRKYGRLFHPHNLPVLSAEDFKSFLSFSNNHHWKGIQRHSGALTSDMPRLREALAVLLDESRPVESRLRRLRPAGGEPLVKGLARSVITPIMLVVYPEKYGVLNRVAEEAMKTTGVYPLLPASADFAQEYLTVNEVLLQIKREFSLPLWFVDDIWWRIAD